MTRPPACLVPLPQEAEREARKAAKAAEKAAKEAAKAARVRLSSQCRASMGLASAAPPLLLAAMRLAPPPLLPQLPDTAC